MADTPPDPDDDLTALDVFAPDVFTPDAEPATSDLDALDFSPAGDEPNELTERVFAVTNPPGTVTVESWPDGRVGRIALSQNVTTMTEADLAEEIVVIARLATQDARAAQYADMLEGMREQGHDDASTREFLTRDLDLPSPDDAVAARTQVFTTRYAGEE